MAKNMSVARVVQYTTANIGKAERHNERKNESYENLNVDPDRIRMNIHFRDPGDGSYMDILRKKEGSGEVSTRGLRQDAKLFDEMIIDVNTIYFEEHGGYDYARKFFEEAFHFVEEKYGSGNIISAVMHADEINQASTEQCGHPVYHYHLHVMALPVVEKEIRWSTRCKDPQLVGTVKEVINQISHSKKWESRTPELDSDGNPVLRANGKPKFIKSYSVLQDELFDHMQEAGFKDFERGERGSAAQHLSSLQYQYQKDKERLAEIEQRLAAETIDYETNHEIFRMYSELDGMGKKTLTGKIVVPEKDYRDAVALAKEGLSSRARIKTLEEEIRRKNRRISSLNTAVNNLEHKLDELQDLCRPYLDVVKRFPEKVKAFLEELIRIPLPEKKENVVRKVRTKKQTHDEWSR